jgi:hypothetical protein
MQKSLLSRFGVSRAFEEAPSNPGNRVLIAAGPATTVHADDGRGYGPGLSRRSTRL